ncbi:hypothetical protein NC653_026179 [Populus alba x Populus x berolinensis]|uniref:DUF155 domain-containing protein n=1 Tax=Populus alba x Populus x berolinensis TaxID=444605 RepID=A0AAD6Q8V8_9ROSI|nr:hypothetical protein NC653_026179 [Populus alba x Populus x berolinensis]
MWRAIDAHSKTIRFSLRTVLFSYHQNPLSISSVKAPNSSHFFSLSKTLSVSSSTPNPSFSILAFTTRHCNNVAWGGGVRGGNLVVVRGISSISASASPNQQHTAVDWNEPVFCSDVGVGGKGTGVEEDTRPSIPVRAFFFSTSVDLKSVVEQNKQNFIPPTSRMTNYVVLKFGNLSQPSGLGSCISGSSCSYMVVFQYGSIVLFNVREHEVDEYVNIVRRHASGLLPEMRKDEYEVREKPTLNTWMQGGLDYIMLQFLNTDGIRTIGSVLGQSIALDYYGRQVDDMVAEFTDINRGMEKTGTFSMDSKKLFQIVGKANSNLADVILKLGLFERTFWEMTGLGFGENGLYGRIYNNKKEERGPEILKAASICCSMYCGCCFVSILASAMANHLLYLPCCLMRSGSDIAWKDAKYAQIWEYLRDEFELTQRFASLDFKLKFVEHNIRFLQEILQNRKSDFLEWLIIVLIGVEIIISVFDIVHRSGFKFF